ncbi:hypothetical protein AB0M29_28820 [Streptomyces sp. NPDC051976]|uniref:hypothetical protein n=1 Tax=Streptomyces sp. NPDC051976 TaxID=3154947 RepID=UPI00343E73AC
MIAHPDNDPGFDPDDPLTVLLRPTPEYASAPDGRYSTLRRRAARRRLLRTAAGIGVSCAVAAIIALPVHLKSAQAPASPTVPLAPPPASSTPAVHTAPASPEPVSPRPTPTPTKTMTPATQAAKPSTAPNGTRPTPTPIRP